MKHVQVPVERLAPGLEGGMRFLKTLLLVVGIILIVGAIGLGIYDVVQIDQMLTAGSTSMQVDLRLWVILMGVLALVGGLLTGIGLVLPNASFNARYEARRKNENILAAKQAGFAGATSVPRTRK